MMQQNLCFYSNNYQYHLALIKDICYTAVQFYSVVDTPALFNTVVLFIKVCIAYFHL